MTTSKPTPYPDQRDLVKATWLLDETDLSKLDRAIACAITDARAEERERCAAIVREVLSEEGWLGRSWQWIIDGIEGPAPEGDVHVWQRWLDDNIPYWCERDGLPPTPSDPTDPAG